MAKAKDEHKLDIFRVLKAADTRDKDFFGALTEEERKGFSPLVAMRWMAGVRGSNEMVEYYLDAVNKNVNMHFWELRDHPELQYRMMARVGVGERQAHEWVPMPKRKKDNKLHEFLLQWHPDANDMELELLLGRHTAESFRDFVMSCGINDDEAGEVIGEFKKLHGKRAKV